MGTEEITVIKTSQVKTKKRREKHKFPKFNVYVDAGDIDIEITYPSSIDARESSVTINYHSVDMSCGILELDGVSLIEEGIIDDMISNGYSEECAIRITKAAIKEAIGELKLKCRKAFIMASNNKRTPKINTILSELCIVESPWKKSPKTNNMIKVWTL